MNFYNINNPSEKADLKKAVLSSLPKTPGLYMPEYLPVMHTDFIKNLGKFDQQEIAFEVTKTMLGSDLPDNVIEDIITSSITFPLPLVQLSEKLFVLELFHGPTLAFKDVGARFMAALFEYLLRGENRETTILAATSGDTGSAVANSFFGKKGIKVVILYPSGRVSRIQEKMLTTVGGNVTAIEVDGTFDDCQRMVKEAFSDQELNLRMNLTSANSINFARLFPQTFYYFGAASQLKNRAVPFSVSVPSGNYGNLTAGIIAGRMGLAVKHFIASSNANNAVTDYLATGKYLPKSTIPTLTNAMDVGDPGNFPRLLRLFSDSHDEMTAQIKGYWFSDTQTLAAIDELSSLYGYQADPHGAVAYLGINEYLKMNDATGIFLETAHPVKFNAETGNDQYSEVNMPENLRELLSSQKVAIKMAPLFSELKSFLCGTH
jgi:threonine synthase